SWGNKSIIRCSASPRKIHVRLDAALGAAFRRVPPSEKHGVPADQIERQGRDPICKQLLLKPSYDLVCSYVVCPGGRVKILRELDWLGLLWRRGVFLLFGLLGGGGVFLPGL